MRKLLPIVLALAFTCVGTGPVLAADDGFEHGLSAGGEVTTREIGDGSLTTLFASNNGFAGNSFDLTAAVNLTVVGWDMNLDAGTWNVEIYYRMGTANGYEQNPGAWTLLGTELVVGAGVDQPTHVDIGGLTLASGDLVGIVARVQEYSAFNYTNGGPNNYSVAPRKRLCGTHLERYGSLRLWRHPRGERHVGIHQGPVLGCLSGNGMWAAFPAERRPRLI